MYIFEHSQSQKYGKIFLVFREIRAKVDAKKRIPPHHCEGTPNIVVQRL